MYSLIYHLILYVMELWKLIIISLNELNYWNENMSKMDVLQKLSVTFITLVNQWYLIPPI